ncbi:MAG: transcription antitermination factor NusB [Microscillaceae bacterium]|nr:transcription antitermination factor NusB [Microscillaceae bacterium]
MLNRRYLRIKVMQSLYALELAKDANYQVALDLVNQAFVLDWDEKIDADYEKIALDKQLALQIYQQYFEINPGSIPKNENTKAFKAALDAIHYYQNQITRDKNFYAKNLLTQVDTIYEIYISILSLLIELSETALIEREKALESETAQFKSIKEGNFETNSICLILRKNDILETEIIKRGINWRNNRVVLNEIYHKILRNDPVFQEYDLKSNPNFEDHKEIIKHIIKETIFKKKTSNQFIVSETQLDQASLDTWLQKFNTTEIFSKIRESIPEVVEEFTKEIPEEIPNHPSLVKALRSRLDKIYKDIYQDVKFIDSSSNNFSPRVKFQKTNSTLEKVLETSPMLSQQLIKQAISEIINHLSSTLESTKLNHVDNQSSLTSILINTLNFFMGKIGLPWSENTRVTLKIEAVKKHSPVNEYFEEMDINWSENAKIIQSMVQNTIKNIQDQDLSAFELVSLSKNWEEDSIFYQDLYRKNIEESQKYDEIIVNKSKNWDLSRLALIDKIILKMAICEMIHFYSIPVKVSINEYIELSKIYSTVKSKQFINGLLDAISQELIQKRIIKKSGRGLLDNK